MHAFFRTLEMSSRQRARPPRSGIPERLAAITLTGRFVTDLAGMVDRWAEWAGGVVAERPDEPGLAEPDWPTLHAIARRDPGAGNRSAPGPTGRPRSGSG